MSERPSVSELVECLRRGEKNGRDQLRQLCLGSIERLVERVFRDYRPTVDRSDVIDRTLRWVEFYLRSRPPLFFDGMNGRAFLALILSSAYKMLTPPELDGSRRPAPTVSEPLQCPSGYQVWKFCLPCEQVAGDWLGVDYASCSCLWTLVIDVTAHGYASYITAQAVSHLWQTQPIARLRALSKSPGEVLSLMSQELETVLPEDVFVEASLGRFTADGEASLSGAGVCRVILRRAAHEHVHLSRFGGHLLGCFWGNDHDELNWSLLADDELTIASDGLYEQPDLDGQHLEHRIVEYVTQRLAEGRTMHKAVIEVVHEVVGAQPIQDDISVLSVVRGKEVRP
jgi:hypothetical protein